MADVVPTIAWAVGLGMSIWVATVVPFAVMSWLYRKP